MVWFLRRPAALPGPGDALPGRTTPIRAHALHHVLGTPLEPPFPDGFETAVFGLGCFWGAERLFWQIPGVFSSAAGYAGGYTPNPTYEEVCSGGTDHAEVVRIVFDPSKLSYERLLKTFWESHDPTQGMRQGNDVGTQYRSCIHVADARQRTLAEATRDTFQAGLAARGLGQITTEILDAPPFYLAEDYHQQYLSKNPNGYCGLAGTGVTCPVSLAAA